MEKITFNLKFKGNQVVLNTMPASSLVRRELWKIQEDYKSVIEKQSGKNDLALEMMAELTDDEREKIRGGGKNEMALVMMSKYAGDKDKLEALKGKSVTNADRISLDNYALDMFRAVIDASKEPTELKELITGKIDSKFYLNLDITEVNDLINSFCKKNSI